MSDWHFGMDYDMWLYPPVPLWDPDWDFDLPEPIEAANIEGTLLVNAEDAIEQVRRLQDENERLRDLIYDLIVDEERGHDDDMTFREHVIRAHEYGIAQDVEVGA